MLLVQDVPQGVVLGRVVGGAVLPAAPDHVEPGAGQDADGVGVVFAAGAGVVVDGRGPGAGVPGVAGEVADGVAELAVDRPPEADRDVLAGSAGDRCDPGQARQRLGVGEPCPAVPGLGQQARRAQCAGAGQGGEDVRVRVGGELGGDLGLQDLDLAGQGTQGGHQSAGDGCPGRSVGSGSPAGGGMQPRMQLLRPGGVAPVGKGMQPCGQVFLAQLAGRILGAEAGQERQADLAVQAREQPGTGGERRSEVGAQLVAGRDAVRRPGHGGRGRPRAR